jgi:WD40 repeat protein
MGNSCFGTWTSPAHPNWVRFVAIVSKIAIVECFPERRERIHMRAIHKISYSALAHNYCVTGGADGDVRVWVWSKQLTLSFDLSFNLMG